MKSESVTIQMKATEQSFPVVLFIMLYNMVLTFEVLDEIIRCGRHQPPVSKLAYPQAANRFECTAPSLCKSS